MAFTTGAITAKFTANISDFLEKMKSASRSLEDFGSKGKRLEDGLKALERRKQLVIDKMNLLESAGKKGTFMYKSLANQLAGYNDRISTHNLKVKEFIEKNNQANNSLNVLINTLKNANNAFKPVSNAIGSVIDTAKNATLIFAGLTTGVIGYGTKMAGTIQQQAVALDTILGSEDARRKLLTDITALAKVTPFERFDLINSSKLLLAMGISAETVVDTMKVLGDVSAGVSANIEEVSFVFGQVKAQGQAYTQDLNQFASRGIPIYEEVAKVLGISVAQLREGMGNNKIKVNFDTINKAFQNLTSEGGKFNNLMLKQSRTLPGIWSNLKDMFDTLILRFMGISDQGDVRQGSLFDKMLTASQTFANWLSANEAVISDWGSRVFTKIGNGIGYAWVNIISPVLVYFQNWFNTGGKEAIQVFIQQALELLKAGFDWFRTTFVTDVMPRLIEFGEYLKSEDFKNAMIATKDAVVAIANAVKGLIDNLAEAKRQYDEFTKNDIGNIIDKSVNLMNPFDPKKGEKFGKAVGDFWNKNVTNVLNRASGGPVQAGRLYEVGENNQAEMLMMNGKQYMIPGNNGQILNQKQIGKNQTGGQTTQNITFNINGNQNPEMIWQYIQNKLALQNTGAKLGINRYA